MFSINNFEFSSEYDSWTKEKASFNSKYRSSTLDKVKLFFGCYRKELKEHQARLNQYCFEASKKCSLAYLSNRLDFDVNQTFLRNVGQFHFDKIDQRKDGVGFTWKVKKNGITHYVVGTSHAATKNMVENAAVKESIQKTKMLVTELKGNRFLVLARKLERWFLGLSSIKYAIDDELMELAWDQKKKNIGLETVMQQTKLTFDMRANLFSFFSAVIELSKNQKAFHCYMAAEAWLNGKEDVISMESIPDSLSKDRNVNWLRNVPCTDPEGKTHKGLVELLENTKSPTCVAVGFAHCIGGERVQGLIHVLRNEGFEIERI